MPSAASFTFAAVTVFASTSRRRFDGLCRRPVDVPITEAPEWHLPARGESGDSRHVPHAAEPSGLLPGDRRGVQPRLRASQRGRRIADGTSTPVGTSPVYSDDLALQLTLFAP